MNLTIGSLFTGYGGLDIAVEAAFGARAAWVSDIDKGACKVLAHRYPGVPNLGDITAVDWSAVELVDIITGGSPCQDLSHAGRRAGMTEGTRSNLWVAMREAIAQIRPTYVIWENVRGAFSADADSELVRQPRLLADVRRRDGEPVLRALGRVLGDLSDLGYDTQWRGLRAADVGAPHGRFRVFVVARLADATGDTRWVEHGDGRPAADAASDGRHEGRTESARVVGRPDAAERGHADARLTLLPSPRTSDTNGAGHHGDGGIDLRTAIDELDGPSCSCAMTESSQFGCAKHGGDDHARRDGHFGEYAPAIARWEAVTDLLAPSPTEPTGRGGAHRLSPRFTEWMMGLPAGWITDVPDIARNEALKLCGNGVVPQQASAAIRNALAVDAVSP